MQMIPVSSSWVKEIGYDINTKTMRIAFDDALCEYDNIPAEFFKSFTNSASKGQFVHAHIKDLPYRVIG